MDPPCTPGSAAITAGSMSLSSTPASFVTTTQTARGHSSVLSGFCSIIAPKRALSFNLKVVKAKMSKNGKKN